MAWNSGDTINYYGPDVVTEVKLTQEDIYERNKRLNEPIVLEREIERFEKIKRMVRADLRIGAGDNLDTGNYFNAQAWCEVELKDTWRLARDRDGKTEYFECSCGNFRD